jgi:hypothetical protein
MRGDNNLLWLVVLGIALLISILTARSNGQRASREQAGRLKAEGEVRSKNDEISELKKTHTRMLDAVQFQYQKLLDHMRALDKVFVERKIQFPWLVSAIADLHALEAERDAQILEAKKHAAVKSAGVVREHGAKRREAERQSRLMRYRVQYYEKLFPWIADYVGDDVPDETVDLSGSQAEPTDDPVRYWLNDAEYRRLSETDKNQLALDRWKTSSKSRWEVGRDYERFIGYNSKRSATTLNLRGRLRGFKIWAAILSRAVAANYV